MKSIAPIEPMSSTFYSRNNGLYGALTDASRTEPTTTNFLEQLENAKRAHRKIPSSIPISPKMK